MLKRELLVFSLISIVFLAGCGGRPVEPSGLGVVIESFSTDIQEVESNSDATFLFTVRNGGGREAVHVGAVLFGLSPGWKAGAFTQETVEMGDLSPADPSINFVGEESTQTFTLRAPTVTSSDTTFTASLRVVYKYSTVSESLIRFVTSDYLRTSPNAQRGLMSTHTTAGPLLVKVTAQNPIISGTSPTEVTVQFEIQNIGSGAVFKRDASTTASSGYDLTVDTTELNIFNEVEIEGVKKCGTQDAPSGTTTVTFADTIRMGGSKSVTVNCKMDVDPTKITGFTDLPVKLTAKYGYYTDGSMQVTVKKKP